MQVQKGGYRLKSLAEIEANRCCAVGCSHLAKALRDVRNEEQRAILAESRAVEAERKMVTQ